MPRGGTGGSSRAPRLRVSKKSLKGRDVCPATEQDSGAHLQGVAFEVLPLGPVF